MRRGANIITILLLGTWHCGGENDFFDERSANDEPSDFVVVAGRTKRPRDKEEIDDRTETPADGPELPDRTDIQDGDEKVDFESLHTLSSVAASQRSSPPRDIPTLDVLKDQQNTISRAQHEEEPRFAAQSDFVALVHFFARPDYQSVGGCKHITERWKSEDINGLLVNLHTKEERAALLKILELRLIPNLRHLVVTDIPESNSANQHQPNDLTSLIQVRLNDPIDAHLKLYPNLITFSWTSAAVGHATVDWIVSTARPWTCLGLYGGRDLDNDAIIHLINSDALPTLTKFGFGKAISRAIYSPSEQISVASVESLAQSRHATSLKVFSLRVPAFSYFELSKIQAMDRLNQIEVLSLDFDNHPLINPFDFTHFTKLKTLYVKNRNSFLSDDRIWETVRSLETVVDASGFTSRPPPADPSTLTPTIKDGPAYLPLPPFPPVAPSRWFTASQPVMPAPYPPPPPFARAAFGPPGYLTPPPLLAHPDGPYRAPDIGLAGAPFPHPQSFYHARNPAVPPFGPPGPPPPPPFDPRFPPNLPRVAAPPPLFGWHGGYPPPPVAIHGPSFWNIQTGQPPYPPNAFQASWYQAPIPPPVSVFPTPLFYPHPNMPAFYPPVPPPSNSQPPLPMSVKEDAAESSPRPN